MGEIVEFPSNGASARGYLATPEAGSGLGVVVIQEWWGLVHHIEEVCDRFAAEGFVALAPDFYHGKTAGEPDEAMKLMMGLQLEQAGKDLSGAVDAVSERAEGRGVGVVGFCMGGALAIVLGSQRPDLVRGVVSFYGVTPWPAWPQAQPNWSGLPAFLGHFAEHDDFANAEAVESFVGSLGEAGNDDVTVHDYPGTEHAFFNDERPEVHSAEASQLAWARTLEFLRARLV